MSGAIIGFSFSLETGSVAVRTAQGRVLERVLEGHRSHANDALGSVKELMQIAGIAPTDVAAVAADIGPGGFTGLRTACGMAQGLAIGWGVPCVGISSLALMARQAFAGNSTLPMDATCLTVLDARQGEVYAAAWQRGVGDGDDDVIAVMQPALVAYGAALSAGQIGECRIVCGPGLVHLGMPLPVATHLASILPTAHALVDMAAKQVAAGRTIAPVACQPLYVRQQIALTTEQRRAKAGA